MQLNGGTPAVTTYNAANQITNAGVAYDAAGNLTNDGTAAYTYDALNRTTARGSTAYAYNGDGTLVSQITGGVTTRYTQDLAAPLSQVLQTQVGAAARTDYLYGLQRLAALQSSVRTWYVADALGSVRRTVTDAGVPLGVVQYDPWGSVESGTVPTFGFTGELQDTTAGLVYLRARWYHAGQGRFASVDPFAGAAEQPYSFHPYQYAYADPVRLSDPSGRCSRNGDDYCYTDNNDTYRSTPVLVPVPGPLPAPPRPTSTPTPPPVLGKNVAQQILDQSGGGVGAASLAARNGGGAGLIAGLFCVGMLVAVASDRVPVRPVIDYVPAPAEYVSVPEPQNQSTPIPLPPVQRVTATPDPCDSLDVPKGFKVAQVVGVTDKKAGQDSVTKHIVVQYARAMCKGATFPPIHITYGVDFDTVTDGHHRFVASRLSGKPIAEIPDPVTIDARRLGTNWPRSFEWKDVRWT
ncbi:MAG: RHS repeat-associated core domain-containing protein [Kouleothrix sp.]|nr:RHS repeat-associated core domain-containing protein [Kouleothrix sp.]